MKKMLVSAEMFGYGPIATCLNVAKELKKYDDVQLDFIGSGIAMEQARMSHLFTNHFECKTYDMKDLQNNKHIFNQYSNMLSSENPNGAIYALENGIKNVYYIDNLVWMWDKLDERLNDVKKFFVSETIPSSENFERIGKNIKNPVFIGPLRDIEEQYSVQTEDCSLIINIGGAEAFLLDKNLVIQFYNKLINAVLSVPGLIDFFKKITICGGSGVISSLQINNPNEKIIIKTLPHEEYLEQLDKCSHCIMASGLGNFTETLWRDKNILFLPPINYSQFLQFKYYDQQELGYQLINWNSFSFFKEVPTLLDEESGVELVLNNVKQYLNSEDEEKITNLVKEYLQNYQTKFFSKRRELANSYKQNASKQVAEMIYQEI